MIDALGGATFAMRPKIMEKKVQGSHRSDLTKRVSLRLFGQLPLTVQPWQ
jgi:hypothetical protein